jgi:hypothetical protein
MMRENILEVYLTTSPKLIALTEIVILLEMTDCHTVLDTDAAQGDGRDEHGNG